MRYPKSLVIVAAAIAAIFFGCAAKPGTALAINEATPVTFGDPTGTQSSAVLGQQTTTTTGPLAVETSKLVEEGLYETNAGGAAKQRGAFTIGRQLRGMLSGASDLDIAGVEIAFGPEGDPLSLKIAKIGTSNSAVQRAVNEGIVALVTQWQRASDNEKAVLLAQIEAQAKLGDAAAKGAVEIIKSFVLPTP